MHSLVRRVLAARIGCAVLAVTMPCFALPAASAEIAIKIDNFVFTPDNVTIKPGDTVVWTNADDIPHTVVSMPIGTFKSKAMDTDDKFSFTFDKAGSYDYFCSLHPHMKGKIVVAP